MERTDLAALLLRLTQGNEAFARSPLYAMERRQTFDAQHPCVVVVSCSDSRVSAPIVFSSPHIGVLFESKTAGQALSSSDIESVRYAIVTFTPKPRAVIVMGHTGCGAVHAATDAVLDQMRSANPSMCAKHDGKQQPQQVFPTIVRNIAPAVREAVQTLPADVVQSSIDGDRESTALLVNTASAINARQKAQELAFLMADTGVPVVAALYDISTGRVHWLAQ